LGVFYFEASRSHGIEGWSQATDEWKFDDLRIDSVQIVDLSKTQLRLQLAEIQPSHSLNECPDVYFYLPHFTNLSTANFMSIRNEHGDLFGQYNRAMHSFFADSAAASTETKLLDAMKAADEEVRRVEKSMRKIAKSSALQKAGISVKVLAAVLCACFLTPESARLLISIIGGSSLSDAVNYFNIKHEGEVVAHDPFYFAWLIHQAGSMSPMRKR
jgi:hypothetical protein